MDEGGVEEEGRGGEEARRRGLNKTAYGSGRRGTQSQRQSQLWCKEEAPLWEGEEEEEMVVMSKGRREVKE